MLIKRNNFMTAGNCRVKKLTRAGFVTLALSATAIAPTAFASDNLLRTKVVTAKIHLTDLQVEGGIDKVYAKLKKRAKHFCRADRSSLQYLDQSVEDCTADLMAQFVESADVDILKTFHLAQQPVTTTTQLASN